MILNVAINMVCHVPRKSRMNRQKLPVDAAVLLASSADVAV